jgi:hypothetical protein
MSIFIILSILAIASVVFAFISLKALLKNEEIRKVRENLKKGRVVFHEDELSSNSPDAG